MPATGVTLGPVFMPVYRQGPDFVDAYGISWLCIDVTGWDDGWDGSGTVSQRPTADGAWVSPQYATPRVVGVKGRLVATSGTWDDATRAWDRLQAAVPFRGLGPILISTGEGTMPDQTALIRQHEKPVANRFGNRIDFSLSLLAPDPRRYATAGQSINLVLPVNTGGLTPPLTPPLTPTGTSSVSQAVAVNSGTTDAPVTITLVGPVPSGAVIANTTTGQAIKVIDAVTGSETLTIDTGTGQAYVGSQARKVTGSFWSLAPGANTISFYATGGYDPTSTATIAWRSAWK